MGGTTGAGQVDLGELRECMVQTMDQIQTFSNKLETLLSSEWSFLQKMVHFMQVGWRAGRHAPLACPSLQSLSPCRLPLPGSACCLPVHCTALLDFCPSGLLLAMCA